MTRLTIFLASAIVVLATTLHAASPTPAVPPPASSAQALTPPPFDIPAGPQTLFALPAGAKCPGGSTLYQGPEARLAARDKMIYCMIARKDIIVLHKTATLVACPPLFLPYKSPDASVTPDADVLWCRMPLPGDPVIPPPIAAPAPAAK